ncbi:hypothetical protein KBZ10_27440 [Streptomyces sp. F63]|uniref:hypothetical protein n=1 Tax=Streptomyces sp. F63 TaxID=2824887 RepID=UPI001B367671|nr:hypothetical protein [Streptomyces sp. F63]MBQ0988180.1 hypothetical protein [Streptomyces sp. F63]
MSARRGAVLVVVGDLGDGRGVGVEQGMVGHRPVRFHRQLLRLRLLGALTGVCPPPLSVEDH